MSKVNSKLKKGDKVYTNVYGELKTYEIAKISAKNNLIEIKLNGDFFKETGVSPYFYGHRYGYELAGEIGRSAYINRSDLDNELRERELAHKWIDLINAKKKIKKFEDELNY